MHFSVSVTPVCLCFCQLSGIPGVVPPMPRELLECLLNVVLVST